MALYCGIDLHSNNSVVSVIDDNDRRILEKKLNGEKGSGLAMPHHSQHRWRTARNEMGSLVCLSPSYCLIANVALQGLTPVLDRRCV